MKIEARDGKVLLAGKRSHFICSADFSFPSKWDGLWFLDTKVLDYVALKVNGEWLGRWNMEKMEYYGHKAIFLFEGCVVTAFVPEERAGLILVVEAKEEAEIEIEFGVDMRTKEENLVEREYSISGQGRMTSFSSDIADLFFRSSAFTEEQAEGYKVHTDGQQKCLVYRAKSSGKRVIFQFSSSPEPMRWALELKAKEEYYRSIADRIRSPNKNLEEAFKWAALSLEMMLRRTPRGLEIYAGLPWFLETWGRDAGWCIPAFTDLGEYRKARMLLETLLRYADPRIPNRLKPLDYYSADATLLWIIAAAHYVRRSGDMDFLERNFSRIREMMEAVWLMDVDADGFPEVDTDAESRGMTWMDSIKRRGEAVEVDGLYLKALEEFYWMAERMGGARNERYLEALRKRFLEKFMRGGILDRAEPDSAEIRPNMLVPAYLKVVGRDYAESAYHAAKNLLLKNGRILSLSWIDSRYSPSSYHNGQAWGIATWWFHSVGALLGEREGIGILNDFRQDGLGHFGESWDAESGELLGCFAQAWSAALLIRHVDEFLLGLEISHSIKASPSKALDIWVERKVLFNGWRRVKVSRNGLEVSNEEKMIADFFLHLEKNEGYQPRESIILSYLEPSLPASQHTGAQEP